MYLFLGVKFIIGYNIEKFIPNEQNPEEIGQIELSNGDIIPTNIAILGIGSTFNTDWLKGTPIKMHNNGSVETNEVF